MSTVQQLLEQRTSTNFYDVDRDLSDAQIQELVRQATLAPSAFNFQNWQFIAVRSKEAKAKLKAAAYNQQKIEDASVTFIVCGTLQAHTTLKERLQGSVDTGIVPAEMAAMWVEMAKGAHADNPILQRDEAFRSASLAAMTLMIAAAGMGLASGAMSGFTPAQVASDFELSENEIPVILITVGYPKPGSPPQKLRRPIGDVLRMA